MPIKVLLSPLVSEDYYRSVRAIKSCYLQSNHNLEYGVHVVINSLDENFVDEIVGFCLVNNIDYTISESDGTPSTGKNAVFDVFKNSDYTHLSQLDGDDIFYPAFLTQTQRHLTKYPNTDVLSTIPMDVIADNEDQGMFKLENGQYTLLWGTHYYSNEDWCGKFGRDRMADGISIPNYGRFVLYSKKVVDLNLSYDKEVVLGEDKKIHFDFLSYHQMDRLSYWFTLASDMWICDKTTNGIQKKYSGQDDFPEKDVQTTNYLRAHIAKIMWPERSAPGEIPIDFPPIFMLPEHKLEFLNKIL